MARNPVTQKERLKIWREVRRRVKMKLATGNFRERIGLCGVLWDVLKKRNIDFKSHEMLAFLKLYITNRDLEEHKPAEFLTVYTFWWWNDAYGWQTRLEVCNDIIKKLEHKK